MIANLFQLAQEQAACLRRVQPWLATAATEGNVVKLTALLETFQTPRHGREFKGKGEEDKRPKDPTLGKIGQG